MLELLSLMTRLLNGEKLPPEVQEQIDDIVDRFALTVADRVIRHINEGEPQNGLSSPSPEPELRDGVLSSDP